MDIVLSGVIGVSGVVGVGSVGLALKNTYTYFTQSGEDKNDPLIAIGLENIIAWVIVTIIMVIIAYASYKEKAKIHKENAINHRVSTAEQQYMAYRRCAPGSSFAACLKG